MTDPERVRREPKVTEEDKRRMRVLARDLKEAEVDTLVEGDALRALVEEANAWRAEHGIPPLDIGSDEDDPPELELYRRARELGMVRRRR